MITILTGVRWYLIVVVICISVFQLTMLNIFSYACWPSVCPHWKIIHLGLLPISQSGCLCLLILSCMRCLYILDINPLSVLSFANIFSHLVDCLFILLMVSLAVKKLFSLTRSRLFIFSFVSFALGDRSKKILLRFMSKSVLPMFSSASFMVSSLTFRSLIHFELIFDVVWENVLISFFCM